MSEETEGCGKERDWNEETEREIDKMSMRYSDGELARCRILFPETSSPEKLLQVAHAVQRALWQS